MSGADAQEQDGPPPAEERIAREYQRLQDFENQLTREQRGTATRLALNTLTNRIGLHVKNAADPSLPVDPITAEDLAGYYEQAVAIGLDFAAERQSGAN